MQQTRSARRAFWGVVRFALAEYGSPIFQSATGAGESKHSITGAGTQRVISRAGLDALRVGMFERGPRTSWLGA